MHALLWEDSLPVLLVFGLQCTNHIDKSLVKSLILAASFLMIRCCSHLSDMSQPKEFFDQLGLKITSLVG